MGYGARTLTLGDRGRRRSRGRGCGHAGAAVIGAEVKRPMTMAQEWSLGRGGERNCGI